MRAQEAGALRVTTRDPTHVVKKVVVGWRWAASGDFTQVTIAVGSGVPVDVPAPPPGKTRAEYYAQALDDRDDVVFESGSPTGPKTAIVDTSGAVSGGSSGGKEKPAGGGSSVTSSPVFWTVIAVVVVGGATAAFLALRPK